MQLSASELSYFQDIRALDYDPNGHLVFIGLSYEESLRLKRYHDSYLERENWSDPDDYVQLMIKHEYSRLLSGETTH